MVRRYLLLRVLAVLLLPSAAAAQFTLVSGTVNDPNSLHYSYGTLTAKLVISGSPVFTATGLPYTPPTQPVGLDVNGSFTMQLASNSALTPSGSTWSFTVSSTAGTVPPAFGTGPQSFTVTGVTISGSTQSLSSTLSSAAPALTVNFGNGTGTVTTFSAGNLSPIFTTSVSTANTTPALTFNLTNAAANTILGNFTGSSAGPTYGALPSCSGANQALNYTSGSGFGCVTISGGGGGVSGSGTGGLLPVWTGSGASTALGNSDITFATGTPLNSYSTPSQWQIGGVVTSGSTLGGFNTLSLQNQVTLTGTGTAQPAALNISVTDTTATAGANVSEMWAGNITVTGESSATGQTAGMSVLGGFDIVLQSPFATNVINQFGILVSQGGAGSIGATSTVTNRAALETFSTGVSGTVTNDYGLWIEPSVNNGIHWTNHYGIFIGNQDSAGTGSNANPWGIFEASSTEKNELGALIVQSGLTTNITGSTQCVQANSAGLLSGTGSACGSGGGAVNSVTNTDNTLSSTPTTGSVVVSLDLPAISNPTGTPTGTPSGTGGTVAAGTNFAKIIALDVGGRPTAVGTESASVTTSGTTSSIAWNWTAVTGAASYYICVGATSGNESNCFTSNTNSFTQTLPISQGTTAFFISATNFTGGPNLTESNTAMFPTGSVTNPSACFGSYWGICVYQLGGTGNILGFRDATGGANQIAGGFDDEGVRLASTGAIRFMNGILTSTFDACLVDDGSSSNTLAISKPDAGNCGAPTANQHDGNLSLTNFNVFGQINFPASADPNIQALSTTVGEFCVNAACSVGWAAAGLRTASTGILEFMSGGLSSTVDTGLSRDSAAVVDVGNGSAGDTSGTLQLTTLNAVGTNGGIVGLEGTCANAAPAATKDVLCPNSTAHWWEISGNNSALEPVAGINGSVNTAHFAGFASAHEVNDSGVAIANVCAPSSFAAQTDGATVTWAIGSATCANASLTFTVHSGSRTLALTGLVNGGSYVLKLIQDSTGGEGLTLGSGCTWKVINGGGGAITLSTGANAVDILSFTYDGTNCNANLGKNYS